MIKKRDLSVILDRKNVKVCRGGHGTTKITPLLTCAKNQESLIQGKTKNKVKKGG